MVRNRLPVVLLLALFCSSRTAGAQFDPLADPRQAPQARSQLELDDYIEILQAPLAARNGDFDNVKGTQLTGL